MHFTCRVQQANILCNLCPWYNHCELILQQSFIVVLNHSNVNFHHWLRNKLYSSFPVKLYHVQLFLSWLTAAFVHSIVLWWPCVKILKWNLRIHMATADTFSWVIQLSFVWILFCCRCYYDWMIVNYLRTVTDWQVAHQIQKLIWHV